MTGWGSNFHGHALRVHAPDGSVRALSLDKPALKIGSARDNDLVLDDPCVAPHHCRIVDERGALVVRDRGSQFGTTVNRTRCSEPTRLVEGDRVGIGAHVLEVMRGRPHIDTDQIAAQLRQTSALTEEDGDAALALRLDQAAAAWHALRRPHRLLPGTDRLARAATLTRPLAPLTTTWLAVAAARRRLAEGIRWCGLGAIVGLAGAAPLAWSAVAAAPRSEPADAPARPDPRPVSPAPAQPAKIHDVVHAVLPGETLARIARHYRVEPEQIERWNNLDPAAPLEPDSLLHLKSTVPAPIRTRQLHVVAPGDTWDNLADRHGVTAAFLQVNNPTRDELRPGDWLGWESAASTAGPGAPPTDHVVPETPVPDLQLPASTEYDLRCAFNAYANGFTARHLVAAVSDLRARHGFRGQLVIGDLSREDGGAFGKHLSHKTGRDVDIWLPHRAGFYSEGPACSKCGTPWCRPTVADVDWRATWSLISALHATDAVKEIFLDRRLHAELREAARDAGVPETEVQRLVPARPGAQTLVLHAASHTRHIHVRFRCDPASQDCRD